MKENLLNILYNHKAGETYVLKLLCCSMTYLIVHIHEIWPNFMEEISKRFELHIPEQSIAFMRMLESIAYDFNDSKLVIEETTKTHFKAFMQLSLPQVFAIFE
jgi:hypothetical protein